MSDDTHNTAAETSQTEDQAEASKAEAPAAEAPEEPKEKAPEADASESEDNTQAEAQAETASEDDPAARIAELNDKLLRAMADAENTRRIAAREKAKASKYAITNFARDILRVADFLNMATMAVTPEARKADQNLDNLCVGVDMTMKELLNVFEAYGIKPIPTDGLFDHNLHEAVSQEENPDVPKGTIVGVQRGGFTIQDRLLRPAQVIVATGGPKPQEPETAEDAPHANDEAGAEGADPAETGEGGQKAYEPGPAQPGQKVDQET